MLKHWNNRCVVCSKKRLLLNTNNNLIYLIELCNFKMWTYTYIVFVNFTKKKRHILTKQMKLAYTTNYTFKRNELLSFSKFSNISTMYNQYFGVSIHYSEKQWLLFFITIYTSIMFLFFDFWNCWKNEDFQTIQYYIIMGNYIIFFFLEINCFFKEMIPIWGDFN